MQITPFGRGWEWRRSIWLVWLLFPFGITSFISFLYIGIRAERIKWIISSVIYFIITVGYVYVTGQYEIDHIVFDISTVIVLTAWLTAWIQALRAREEYLLIIAGHSMARQELLDEQIESYEQQAYKQTRGKPRSPRPLRRRDSETETEDIPTPLNINKATADQLRTLPSIDIMSATEIIRARERKGPLMSYTDLIQTLNIQPHIFSNAKPFMFFSDEDLLDKMKVSNKTSESEEQPDKQREDKEGKPRRGRIVDY